MSVFVGEGDLYEIRNYRTGRASFFEYDHAGRCMASKERAFTVSNGVIHYGAALSSYRYEYDVCNNLTKLTCSVAGASWDTVYTYDSDNRPKTTTTWSGTVLTNTYDGLGRLTKRTWGLGSSYETRLEYWLNGDNRTTLLHRYYNGSDDPFVYGYDDNGNITSITQGSTGITYEYDAANRLTRENNGVTNETVTYEYDDFGNILNKQVYAYTTGTLPATPASTVTYTYASSGWTDQLVSYNGQTIAYDAMGNPTTYRGYTFTWRGKQLMSSVNGSQQITFEYNEDGLRQKKTVNGTDTDYFYNGSVLIGMQRSGTRYLFSYDAAGNVVSVKYNNNEYYYVRNGQGDIVKLIDASGATVVEYIYNTWGKKVTTTGSLAGSLGLIQPFRYRGYVYDYETGFYYLQSRYYDPTTGRFISADVLLSTGQGVMGHNAYAYCLGNPVNMVDDGGNKSGALGRETEKDSNENAAVMILVAAAVIAYLLNQASNDEISISIKRYVDDKAEEKEKPPIHDQSVYIMRYKDGENAGEIGYVGRTNDPDRRRKEHERNKLYLTDFTVIETGLTIDQAKVLEHALIMAYGMQKNGGLLFNLRREIAPKKLLKFMKDFTVFKDLVEGYYESEMLCFLGR